MPSDFKSTSNSARGIKCPSTAAAPVDRGGADRRPVEVAMGDVVPPLAPHRRQAAAGRGLSASSARRLAQDEPGVGGGAGGCEGGRQVDIDSYHGWKKYNFSPYVRRSFPGSPPGERHQPYDMPFGELSVEETAAAAKLGFGDEQSWELAMPRRMEEECGWSDGWTVGAWQAVTWGGLSADRRDAALSLGLDERVWDNKLATFHDDLWWVEGICMDASQFEPVLRSVRRMSKTPLQPDELVRFLLDLGRVLTPSQVRAICQALRSGVAWKMLNELQPRGKIFSVNFAVASFLSDPKRFVDVCWTNRQIYLDDNVCGFWWRFLTLRHKPSLAAPPMTYAAELKRRHDDRLVMRRTAGPILVGALPPHEFLGGSTTRRPLPGLPVEIARAILDDWLEDEPLDPLSLAWIGSKEGTTGSSLTEPIFKGLY